MISTGLFSFNPHDTQAGIEILIAQINAIFFMQVAEPRFSLRLVESKRLLFNRVFPFGA